LFESKLLNKAIKLLTKSGLNLIHIFIIFNIFRFSSISHQYDSVCFLMHDTIDYSLAENSFYIADCCRKPNRNFFFRTIIVVANRRNFNSIIFDFGEENKSVFGFNSVFKSTFLVIYSIKLYSFFLMIIEILFSRKVVQRHV